MIHRTVVAVVSVAVVLGGMETAGAAVSAADLQKVRNALPQSARARPKKPRKLLVFTLARGYRHGSIPLAAKALEMLGKKTGAWEATISDDIAMFRSGTLARFDAIAFVSTTGTLFNQTEYKENLLDFVRSGKGITGFHAATDCFYNWKEFGAMMGGYFAGHPWHENVTVKLDDPKHALMKAFDGTRFEIVDEIYQFRAPYSRDVLRVLLSLDTTRTNMKKGLGRTDGDFAVSWVRRYGNGRVFYCSLGHRSEIWWNPVILRYYLDGIQFALGDIEADTTPGPAISIKSIDPYMGEYVGRLKRANGRSVPAEVEVVPQGGGRYMAVLLPKPEGGKQERLVLRGGSQGGGRNKLDVRLSKDGSRRGVNFAYYEGDWNQLPDFDKLTPVKTGTTGGFEIGKRNRNDNFGFRFTGWLKIAKAGLYKFSTSSDDGSRLFIGGRRIVDNDGLHGAQEKNGKIRLDAGLHPIAVTFFEKGGGEELSVWYAPEAAPPKGEKTAGLAVAGTVDGVEWKGSVTETNVKLTSSAGDVFTGAATVRVPPTLGLKPPPGAVVLLPFEKGKAPSLDAWTNPRWRSLPDGSMEVRNGSNKTKKRFGSAKIHVEFRIPYEPAGRGQGRGNSGVYVQDRYEVQVLDSFGLAPGMGDCGSIYGIAITKENASLPPLHWQTYDITFRAPKFNANGRLVRAATMTVRHNGIQIHDKQPLPRSTTSAGAGGHAPTGPIQLQDHGHPVRYRNIWVLPLKE